MDNMNFLLISLLQTSLSCEPNCIETCKYTPENCHWLCHCWSQTPQIRTPKVCNQQCKAGCSGSNHSYVSCLVGCECDYQTLGVNLLSLSPSQYWDSSVKTYKQYLQQTFSQSESTCKNRCGQLCKINANDQNCHENCFRSFCQEKTQEIFNKWSGMTVNLEEIQMVEVKDVRDEGQSWFLIVFQVLSMSLAVFAIYSVGRHYRECKEIEKSGFTYGSYKLLKGI